MLMIAMEIIAISCRSDPIGRQGPHSRAACSKRPPLSSYSMLQISETATMEVMTGMNVSVWNAPMPMICLLNSTASSKAKITPCRDRQHAVPKRVEQCRDDIDRPEKSFM